MRKVLFGLTAILLAAMAVTSCKDSNSDSGIPTLELPAGTYSTAAINYFAGYSTESPAKSAAPAAAYGLDGRAAGWGGAVVFNNVTQAADSGTIVIPAGKSVQIKGTFTVTGTLVVSDVNSLKTADSSASISAAGATIVAPATVFATTPISGSPTEVTAEAPVAGATEVTFTSTSDKKAVVGNLIVTATEPASGYWLKSTATDNRGSLTVIGNVDIQSAALTISSLAATGTVTLSPATGTAVTVTGSLLAGYIDVASTKTLEVTAALGLNGTVKVNGTLKAGSIAGAGEFIVDGAAANATATTPPTAGKLTVKNGGTVTVNSTVYIGTSGIYSVPADATLEVTPNGATGTAYAVKAGTVTVKTSQTITATDTFTVDKDATLEIPTGVTLDGSAATGKFDGTVDVKGTLKVNENFGTVAGALGSIMVTGNTAALWNVTMSPSAAIIASSSSLVSLTAGTDTVTIRAASNTLPTFEVAGTATISNNFALNVGQTVKIASGTTTIAASAGTITGHWSVAPNADVAVPNLPKIIISSGAKIDNKGNVSDATRKAVFQDNTGTAITDQTNIPAGTYVLTNTSLTTGGQNNGKWGATWKAQ